MVSAIVRVIEEPRSTTVGERRLITAKVSDGENMVNLIAWDKEAEEWNLKKNEVVEITNAECPRSHKTSHLPPTVMIVPKTKTKKLDIEFPSLDECMGKKFLDEVYEYEYGILEGFATQVYHTVSYFCDKCKKFSDEMCECGNFPGPIFRVSGIFSDGTRTIRFATISETAAENLTCVKKSDAKNTDPKELMNRSYKILGYIRGEKLYIEEVVM